MVGPSYCFSFFLCESSRRQTDHDMARPIQQLCVNLFDDVRVNQLKSSVGQYGVPSWPDRSRPLGRPPLTNATVAAAAHQSNQFEWKNSEIKEKIILYFRCKVNKQLNESMRRRPIEDAKLNWAYSHIVKDDRPTGRFIKWNKVLLVLVVVVVVVVVEVEKIKIRSLCV